MTNEQKHVNSAAANSIDYRFFEMKNLETSTWTLTLELRSENHYQCSIWYTPISLSNHQHRG